MSKEPKIFDHAGSTFDSFLEEEDLLKETEAVALKRVIAWQLKQAMNAKDVTKKQMAEQLHTSRSQVDRLLDPVNVGVSIGALAEAACTVGKCFRVEFTDSKTWRRRRRASRARRAMAGA